MKAPLIELGSYRNNATIIICPTRGMIPASVVSTWMAMVPPQNAQRAWVMVTGGEVGDAYNTAMEQIRSSKWGGPYQYVMTVEDDHLLPRDTMLTLIREMDHGWDMLAALYYTKSDPSLPLALGEPAGWKGQREFNHQTDFYHLNTIEAEKEKRVIEVCGAPMGCTLFKMSLFDEIPYPWFETITNGSNVQGQDLNFCSKLQRAGKKVGVHCGLRIGHLDVATGKVY